MRLESPREVREFRRDARSQTQSTREAMARRFGVALSYFSGFPYIGNSTILRDIAGGSVNAGHINSSARYALNRTDRYLIKIAAASFMQHFDPQVVPPHWDVSPETVFLAQVNEDLLAVVSKNSGILDAVRNASLRRSLAGQWLVGLALNVRSRDVEVDGERGRMTENVMSFFDAPAYRLSIDTGNESRNLRNHEWVIYSDVWSVHKIERVAGIKIDPNTLSQIGRLTPVEQEYANLSRGRVFRQYRQHSKTPGALVHSTYIRTDSGRFGQYFLEIEMPSGDSIVAGDSDTNPFGGDGLPLIRLGGHRSGEGWIDRSDFDLLKDDQDILNLMVTSEQRLLRKTAQTQVVVDSRFFGSRTSKDEIDAQFTNQEYGIIHGNPTNANAKPPQWVQHPGLTGDTGRIIERQEGNLQNQSFRPDTFFGGIKSHVTGDTVRRTMEAAGDVYGQRVVEDLEQYTLIAGVMLGTAIGMVHDRNLGMVAMLRNRAGFNEDAISAILKQDPISPVGDIVIRESNARFRSAESVAHGLLTAVQLGAISPLEWRISMTEDLDLPVSSQDRAARSYAQYAARQIKAGAAYQAIPLRAAATEAVVAHFEMAMLDQKLPPEVREAFSAAIVQQRQLSVSVDAAVMAAGQPQQPEAAPEQPSTDPLDMMSAALAGQV